MLSSGQTIIYILVRFKNHIICDNEVSNFKTNFLGPSWSSYSLVSHLLTPFPEAPTLFLITKEVAIYRAKHQKII